MTKINDQCLFFKDSICQEYDELSNVGCSLKIVSIKTNLDRFDQISANG